MAAIHHGYPAQLAIALEDAQGQAPADWLAAELAQTAAQLAHIECDPTFIRGEAAVENQEHQADLYAEAQPLHGLKTADGGALKTYLHGAETPTPDGQQLAPTWQGRLLQHALGGGARGFATSIASVSSQTEFTVASAEGLEPGHIIAIARQADPNRLIPVQVLDVSGVSVVIDRELPAAIAEGDLIHPSEMAWPDHEALTNPEHANYSTIAALIRRGNRTWLAQGGHLALEGIELERGNHPILNYQLLAAYGLAPGNTPSPPAWPAFTGPTHGRARTLPCGLDTKLFLQAKDSSESVSLHLWSPTFTAGVPIVGNDTVTEVDANMQGRAGYLAQRGQTVLECDVVLDEQRYVDWIADQRFKATYYQVAPAGKGWAIHMPECFSAEPPELVHEGSLKYKLRLRATISALRAKFMISRF